MPKSGRSPARDRVDCGKASLSKNIFDKLSNETRFAGLSFEGNAPRCSALTVRHRRTVRTFVSR